MLLCTKNSITLSCGSSHGSSPSHASQH
ncbi:hypothetical protein E2C01_087849 [Portunus trituberculatus]|uniref:Uncharacterized protein n=1 Tax=Portunus trituberculatus TaxID=210409 RepID=A0A5B7JEG1_PORTR|nr:hypothetical protein [Portunus trituberculatus]